MSHAKYGLFCRSNSAACAIKESICEIFTTISLSFFALSGSFLNAMPYSGASSIMSLKFPRSRFSSNFLT